MLGGDRLRGQLFNIVKIGFDDIFDSIELLSTLIRDLCFGFSGFDLKLFNRGSASSI